MNRVEFNFLEPRGRDAGTLPRTVGSSPIGGTNYKAAG